METRNLRALVFGQSISRLGDNISYIVLITLAYQRDSGFAGVSLMLILTALPVIIVGPFVGVLIDRFNKKHILILCDLIRMILMLMLTLELSSLIFFSIILILSIFNNIFTSTLLAGIPQLVEEKNVIKANSLLQTTESIAVIIGPTIAGILIATFGSVIAFYTNSFTYFVSLLLILFLNPNTTKNELKISSSMQDLKGGFSYVFHSPLIRFLIGTYAIFAFAVGFVNVLSIGYADIVLNKGIKAYGYIESAWGIGMVIGGVATIKILKHIKLVNAYLFSLLLSAGSILMLVILPSFIPALIFFGLIGIGNIICSILSATVIQRESEEIRGKVFSIRFSFLQLSSFIALSLAGFVANWLGVKIALGISGGILLIGAILSLRSSGYRSLQQKIFSEQ